MSKLIVGIHEGHNASAACLEDGAVAGAAKEERYTRIKNQGGLPSKALASLLAGREARDYAYSAEEMVRDQWREKDRLLAFSRGRTRDGAGLRREGRSVADTIDTPRARSREAELRSSLGVDQIRLHRYGHHACHAAAAYYGWGRLDEEVLVLTCDGGGDGLCASISLGRKGELEHIDEIDQSHSVGRLYANVTYLLGMVPLEHEYKLTGLAPYAETTSEAAALAAELGDLFTYDKERPLVWRRDGCPPMQASIDFWSKLLRRRRFDHVAAGAQLFVERFLADWVRRCVRETGIRRVALGGGVFLNPRVNQRILEVDELEELFVFPVCGDDGNAVGSAYLLQASLEDGGPPRPLEHLYLGDQQSDDEIDKAIRGYPFTGRVESAAPADVELAVAELLARGEVVARHAGRMEFGARALGNRSILADPRRHDTIRRINEMAKCRDFWMPFAPSVLPERMDEYFARPKPMPSPYMLVTLPTREEVRGRIPAAIHPWDFSSRPQEVYEGWNPAYHRLLRYFADRTGEGVLLNTSLNLQGEPMARTATDSLRVFDVSGIRHLAIGGQLLSKVG